MIIYNPDGELCKKERIEEAERILNEIPVKHCFISGSFLFKENYKDIDLFVISRSKKQFKVSNKKVKVSIVDFNKLYSLFYHSVSKSCISKNIIPTRPVKVTMSDYWGIINEGIPTLMNSKGNFQKDVRSLVLYTEYFKTGIILDTFQLNTKLALYNTKQKILKYLSEELPNIIKSKIKSSYLKRFFYSQAGFYKHSEYLAQKYLYNLVHQITRRMYD